MLLLGLIYLLDYYYYYYLLHYLCTIVLRLMRILKIIVVFERTCFWIDHTVFVRKNNLNILRIQTAIGRCKKGVPAINTLVLQV